LRKQAENRYFGRYSVNRDAKTAVNPFNVIQGYCFIFGTNRKRVYMHIPISDR